MSIWISPEEIAALPTSGAAWSSVLSAANSSWGSADLSDNNSKHDVLTLAGALVAVRNADNAMRDKTIAGLVSAMASKFARALELSRGLQTYIIAADIIGYRDAAFLTWVEKATTANVQGHSGGDGVIGTAEQSANNWGGHARASLAAAAVYTGRADWIAMIIIAHRAFIGAYAPGNKMKYTSTDWHAGTPQAGINRPDAKRGAFTLSGVLAEDWRRAASYKWLPSPSGYMWEGMQGLVVCAVILHRAGWVAFNESDNAIVRAMDILYGTGAAAGNSPAFKNPAASDDTWITWLVNAYAGTSYPTTAATSGKNMGYTDWTHAKAGTAPPVEPPVEPPPVDPPPVDPPPTGTVTYPMDVIASNGWYVTLPSKVKTTPDTVKIPGLLMYSGEWFYLNSAKDGVIFKAPTDGATTKNSKNPRSELREMSPDGKTQAAWSSTTGTHSMDIEQMVSVLPIGSKPVVVVGQIHDGNDDVTVFRLVGNTTGDRSIGSLWITDGDKSEGYKVTDSYRLGTKFRVGFQVAGGKITYTYNGQLVAYTQTKELSGCYFKAGSYNQAGGIVTKLPDGKSDYAEVTIYALQVCHNGVCTGRAPGVVVPPVNPTPVDPPVDPPNTSSLTVTGTPTAIAALKAFIKADTSSLSGG